MNKQTNRVAGLLDRVTVAEEATVILQPNPRDITQDVNNDDVLRRPRNWSGARNKSIVKTK